MLERLLDRTAKFLAYEGKVSVICSKTTDLIEYMRNLHDLTPTTTAALGRFATISGIMGHTEIKEEEDSITVQFNGKGPAGVMLSVVKKESNRVFVKACIDNPSVELPLKPNGKIDVGGALGTARIFEYYKRKWNNRKGI